MELIKLRETLLNNCPIFWDHLSFRNDRSPKSRNGQRPTWLIQWSGPTQSADASPCSSGRT